MVQTVMSSYPVRTTRLRHKNIAHTPRTFLREDRGQGYFGTTLGIGVEGQPLETEGDFNRPSEF